MLRPMVLAAVSIVAFSAAATADGYAPGPRSYKGCCEDSWEGFYVGAYIGGANADDHIRDVDNLNGGARFRIHDVSFFWGGQAGYNLQRSNIVFGIEVDIGQTDFHTRRFDPNFIVGTFSGLEGGAIGDVTGRLGFSLGPILLYAKGGYAFFDGNIFADNHLGSLGGGRAFAPTFNGWTVGSGAEFKLSPAWSVKVEYLHYEFGSEDATLHTPLNGNFRYSNDLTADAVKIGFNYYFGAEPYAPFR